MTRENAGVWVRVSTGGQDEANQVPDIERHCAAHGYSIERRYELNDKSASKGKQQEKLDEMLLDMRDGTIKVLVCWHSDRVERRGPEELFRLLRQIKDAGGRIESIKEPFLGTEDLSREALTALNAVISHQYSVHLGEQVKLAHDRIRASGAVGPGGIPWGYQVEGPKYNKKLIPTDLCREYAPHIFARCIAGDSCRTIAVWLDMEGVSPKRGAKWHEGSVRKIIHNRVYAGRWQDEAKTKTLAYCEAVISPDVWDRANDALRRRPRRGPVNKDNRPLLANLRCERCEDSPMFRIRLRSRSGKFYYYYRCAGRGAQRKGCGNMVPYDYLEQVVHAWITLLTTEPHQTREWVEGQNWGSEISDVMQDIRELPQTIDPLSEAFDTRMAELKAKLVYLRGRESVPGHYEYHDTGLTVGEYFHSLDYDGQREYLKTRDIRVEKAPKRDGVPGVHLVIDGEDYGVFRLVKDTLDDAQV